MSRHSSTSTLLGEEDAGLGDDSARLSGATLFDRNVPNEVTRAVIKLYHFMVTEIGGSQWDAEREQDANSIRLRGALSHLLRACQ